MGPRARRWLIDGAVMAAVAVVVGLDLWWSVPGTRAADALSYGLLAVTLVAVALRRYAPVIVTLVCVAVHAAFTLLGHRGELLNLATLVGLFTVAVQGSRRRTVVVGGAVVVGSGLLGAYAGGWSSAPVPELLWPTVALLLGEAVRGHRELRREHADREARAVAEQELLAAHRIRQERLRVARDVHDVVAQRWQPSMSRWAWRSRPSTGTRRWPGTRWGRPGGRAGTLSVSCEPRWRCCAIRPTTARLAPPTRARGRA